VKSVNVQHPIIITEGEIQQKKKISFFETRDRIVPELKLLHITGILPKLQEGETLHVLQITNVKLKVRIMQSYQDQACNQHQSTKSKDFELKRA